MDISELIQQIEEIYNKFMISDNTPDMEADLKIQLLEKISSTLAFCNLRKGPNSEQLKGKLNILREKLLNWDPFGPWFKENKDLATETFEIITLAKTIKFEEEVLPANTVRVEEFTALKSTITNEIQNLKNEIKSIKETIKKIGTIKSKPSDLPTSISKPVEIPKPSPEIAPEKVPVVIPKPISVPKSVPEAKTVSKPKPTEVPTPVPLTELPSSSTPKEAASAEPELQNVLSEKTDVEETDTSKLFGLFSKPAEPKPVPIAPVKPSPAIFKSVKPVQVSKPIQKSVPVQPTPSTPISMKSVAPKLVPIKPVEISKPELSSLIKPKPALDTEDPEALYHELISLQGKRYGLERNIKDLKALHQSGSINEDEYKRKLSSKLEDLKKISAKIERIREKLE